MTLDDEVEEMLRVLRAIEEALKAAVAQAEAGRCRDLESALREAS